MNIDGTFLPHQKGGISASGSAEDDLHTELDRLTSSKWRFICRSGEKSLRTIWAELGDEFPEIFNLCSAQTLENAAMDQEMKHPMTEAEEKKYKAGIPKETIAEERIWKKRPDGLAIKMPTPETVGEFVILEFKRMSDVTDQYVTWAKNVAVAQYASIKSALERTLGPQGWSVSQRSFISGAYKISKRTGPTRNPILFQGPASRHRVH